MIDPDQHKALLKLKSDFRSRVLRMGTAEEKSTEALMEIACQLMDLNAGVHDLIEAVHDVANRP